MKDHAPLERVNCAFSGSTVDAVFDGATPTRISTGRAHPTLACIDINLAAAGVVTGDLVTLSDIKLKEIPGAYVASGDSAWNDDDTTVSVADDIVVVSVFDDWISVSVAFEIYRKTSAYGVFGANNQIIEFKIDTPNYSGTLATTFMFVDAVPNSQYINTGEETKFNEYAMKRAVFSPAF